MVIRQQALGHRHRKIGDAGRFDEGSYLFVCLGVGCALARTISGRSACSTGRAPERSSRGSGSGSELEPRRGCRKGVAVYCRGSSSEPDPSPDSIARALDLLKQAERPLIVLGKGAAYAQADEQIRTFIEATGIPYLPMSMAKGLLPDDHPQSAAAARSLVLGNADVAMLIGARLNWLLGHGQPPQWSPDCKVHPVGHLSGEIDSKPADCRPIVGDIKSAMNVYSP